jgi:iron transport multicopper oxidase
MRRFTSRTHLRRTGLSLIYRVVFAGFGGHCDLFNYTGWVVDKSTSGQYLTGFSTNAGPASPPQDGTWTSGGGGAGVWQAGAVITSENSSRLFFATGHAEGGSLNHQFPASGGVHLDILSESMVDLAINPATGLSHSKTISSRSDILVWMLGSDLGSGGESLPSPAVISGGDIARLAITCGKNRICYVTNADNLGGYKMTAGVDAIVQTITPPGGESVFGNVDSSHERPNWLLERWPLALPQLRRSKGKLAQETVDCRYEWHQSLQCCASRR